jgi:hypothetical protein
VAGPMTELIGSVADNSATAAGTVLCFIAA